MSDLCRCADEVRCKRKLEIERLEAKVEKLESIISRAHAEIRILVWALSRRD